MKLPKGSCKETWERVTLVTSPWGCTTATLRNLHKCHTKTQFWQQNCVFPQGDRRCAVVASFSLGAAQGTKNHPKIYQKRLLTNVFARCVLERPTVLIMSPPGLPKVQKGAEKGAKVSTLATLLVTFSGQSAKKWKCEFDQLFIMI